jgi:D-alanine-D-alanine ligase
MKIKVGVFFGGNSVEHEISVITMNQAISSLDP